MLRHLSALVGLLALAALAHAQPLTTAFTYQGQLTTSGAPATGAYDMRFRLYNAPAAGTQLGATLCSNNLAVAAGQFTVQLDFGSQFVGEQTFLEIDVRQDTGLDCSNGSGFTTLAPRQPLTAAPNAAFAINANSASAAATATTATNATQLNGQSAAFYQNAANLSSGALPGPRLTGAYDNSLALTNTSNYLAGSFHGDGSGLGNVPWAGLTGVPSFVLLQPGQSVPVQTGTLHLSGLAQLDTAVNIGLFRPDYLLAVNGPALVRADTADGDALHIGNSASLPLGLTVEANQQLLNLDLNFRATGHVPQNKGAALRLDGRAGNASINFFIRPAGSGVETQALAISEQATVFIGPSPYSTSYFSATDAGVARAYTGVFESTASAGRALLATASSPVGTGLFAIGTAASGANFGLQAVTDSTSGTALLAQAVPSSGANLALHAINSSTGGNAGFFEGPGPDVLVVNNTGSGRGIHVTTTADTSLWATTNTGFAAVDARTVSSIGLHAMATAAGGSNYALYAESASPAGNTGYFAGPGPDTVVIANSAGGRALRALSNSTTALYADSGGGLYGIEAYTAHIDGAAVFARATATTATNYGVLGEAASSLGYGLACQGNFEASGNKQFRIDHPADPEHKYLIHYCTESPEVLNAYSGKVTLNEQGEATVQLPSYFARINKDPRYTLTPVGAAMPLLHVDREISDDDLAQGNAAAPADTVPTCSFTIAGGAPNAKVCWRVEAVRNDRWNQAHGAPVEVDKQGRENGTYQHPDLYNQPPERATFYHEPPER